MQFNCNKNFNDLVHFKLVKKKKKNILENDFIFFYFFFILKIEMFILVLKFVFVFYYQFFQPSFILPFGGFSFFLRVVKNQTKWWPQSEQRKNKTKRDRQRDRETEKEKEKERKRKKRYKKRMKKLLQSLQLESIQQNNKISVNILKVQKCSNIHHWLQVYP